MIPSRPWSILFSDGSGNSFSFWADERDYPRFHYTPVTPELSSSGVYSGGEPAHGLLMREDAEALWEAVLALEQDSSCHIEERRMGSGSLRLELPGHQASFLVGAGEALDGLLELTEPFRSGDA